MNIATIGIDLAKNVFQIHGVDGQGHTVLRKQLKRVQLFTFFANLPTCLIGMESCCGAHFFARRLEAFGHTVKLIAPQFVKPYVKTNKNDAADAEAIEEQLQAWHRADPANQRLREVPGIGFVTATALAASIGDAKAFKNGRQMAARLGLVPKQYSSGGKQVLRGISKRGDSYLRKLLIVGARAVLRHLQAKPGQQLSWIDRLVTRRNSNIAAVALANKNARIAWALLAYDREYSPNYRRGDAQAA